ncbi:MAG: ECF-type sigma factor, partial [Candidatus Sulfotelmatobacter sp.]
GLQIAAAGHSIDVLLLDESLTELEHVDPRSVRVVELRYFGGYTCDLNHKMAVLNHKVAGDSDTPD